MKQAIKGGLWLRVKNLIKKFLLKLRGIAVRLFFLKHVLSGKEKAALYIALFLLVMTGTVKSVAFYRSITKEIPAVGGVYTEAVVGQPEFINPVLASSDSDKTVVSLIYRGLINLDNQNQVKPELATSWELSADQKVYTIHLRPNVTWDDGKPFTSDDVIYTFQMISDPEQKSPLSQNFKDVLVEKVDQATVRLTLKTPYGPFLTSLNVGIIPNGKSLIELNTKPSGIGPYRYINAVLKGDRVDKLILEQSDIYYEKKPFIKRVEFRYVSCQEDAKNYFDQEEMSAIPYVSNRINSEIHSFKTAAKMMLFLNLRDAPFNNKDIRKSLQKNQKLAQNLPFDILIADIPDLVKIADQLKDKINALGFKANIVTLKENDFKERMAKRDFQALIVGIDFGHDYDPYSLWHSSQISGGMNLSGFNIKAADIILEDARALSDPKARQAKYDEFQKILDEDAPYLSLGDESFSLTVDNRVKNVSVAGALTAPEHLRNISSWYIDTKRVRK